MAASPNATHPGGRASLRRLCGVLFGAARHDHLRFTPGVIFAYIGVSLLHGLWDSMRGIALLLTELLTLAQAQRVGFGGAVLLPPTEQQVQLFTIIEIAGLGVVALIGFGVLYRVWSNSRRTSADQGYAAPGHDQLHETGAGQH